ncbi:MAG: hypothetical protein ACM3NF_01930, partial [Gemmatimonadota bacterium]
ALTMMAQIGVPMAALQRIAGYSGIQITAQHYLHVSPETHDATIRALEWRPSIFRALPFTNLRVKCEWMVSGSLKGD